jgi:hypothetical protein
MIKLRFLPVAMGVLLLFLGAAIALAQNIEGIWIGKTEVPNQGTDEITMVLKKGDAGFTGTISDSLGVLAKDTELMDLKVEGAEITCRFPLVDGAMIFVRMTVDGDKMAGLWEHQEGDTGAITLEKQK